MAIETLRRTYAKKHSSFEEIFEESTSTVLEEAERLKKIVKEFSEFARMPSPDKRPCDLNEIVSATLALYKGTVTIDHDLNEVPHVELDRDSMSQVLLNLVENARDAIAIHEDEEKRRIVVRTHASEDDKSVLLVVDDNGPGISKEVKHKLFTPYFTTKHKTGGSGLGLAIVHRIVSDHGGRIAAQESPLGGARFLIELPVPGYDAADLPAGMTGRWGRDPRSP
jgi:two-component system nitrogen regulation sensor histidine kinase NtrY